LGVLGSKVAQLIPPSRESSIFTFPLKPLEAHLMVTFLLMYHASPAFGVWTVICAPVPLTPREALPPFDVKLTFPVKLPVAVGLKRTTTPRLPPVWRLNGLPEKTPKGEDAEALPVRVPPPMFRTVKVRLAEPPTATAAKSCEAGVTLICGGGGVPTPVTPGDTLPALDVKLTLPE